MFHGNAELYGDDLKLDMSEIRSRNSVAYVEKNVTGDNDGVIFGESKNLEDGSANMVSSIVVNYRSFDTLGEVTVLFVASLGVAFLLGLSDDKKALKTKKDSKENESNGFGEKSSVDSKLSKLSFFSEPNFMLRSGSRMLFGFVLLLGVYMMSHGHLTPGGGFPGGSLIAAAFLLLYMGDTQFRANVGGFKVLESTMGTIYVLVGLAGLLLGGSFLWNFLDTGLVGQLFSAGILPIVYVVIGLKVGSELIGVLDTFAHTEQEVDETDIKNTEVNDEIGGSL